MTLRFSLAQQSPKKTVKMLLPFAITTGILGYIAFNYPIEDIWVQANRLSIAATALTIGLLLANLALGIGRMKYLLSYFGAPHIDTYECVRAHVAGLLSGIFIMNLVGSVVGRFALLRRWGIDVATITALVFTEKLLLAVSGMVLVLFGWATLFGSDQLFTALNDAALPEAAIAACLVAITTLTIFRWKREQRMLRRMTSVSSLLRITVMLALSLAAQALMAICYAFIADTIVGADAPSFINLLAVGAVVSFAAAIPVSVNGWGIREITSIYALAKLGVSAPEAVAISVTLGVLATVAVLLSSIVLLKPSVQTDSTAGTTIGNNAGTEIFPAQPSAFLNTNALVLLIASPLTVLLLFFSLHIPINDTVISLNLADPIALLGLIFFLLMWITSRQLPVKVPSAFLYWMAALSLLLVAGFTNGALRIGVTDWALNNRLIGWSVILGYVSVGAMCVSLLGLHGLRRLAEVMIVGAVVITLFDLAHRELITAMGGHSFIASNFEGFARNRNAFALQLLIGLVALLAYARPLAKKMPASLIAFLIGSIGLGIWRTYSLSGLACMVVVLLLAFAARLLSWRIYVFALLWATALVLIINFASSNTSQVVVHNVPEANLVVSGSTSERLLSIRNGLEMWMSHPFFGEGLGTFANKSLGENNAQLVIHSVPVWLLAEFGLFGLGVALSLPFAVALKFIRSMPRKPSPTIILTLGLLLLFALFGVVHDIAYQRFFWLFAGACAAASLKTRYFRYPAKSG